ncbi:hypothetical protein R3P38DRAFT_2835194, partial [Favolaschia claudopus]
SRSGSMPPPPRALSAAPSHSHLRQQNIASEPVVAVATPLQLPRPASTSTSSSSSRSSISTGQLRVPIPDVALSTPHLGVPLPTIPSESMWPQAAPKSTDEHESLWGEAEAEPIAVDEEDDFPPSLYSSADSTGEGIGPRVPFSFSSQRDYNAVPSSSRSALTTIPTPQPSPRIHTNGWNPAASSSTALSTPYTRPEQSSLQPNLFPGTAPIPFCRPSNQGLSSAETLGQTQQLATAAKVMCRWEGCSIVLQIEEIWEHIKTDHRFECRMVDVGLKCRWIGSDGKQCTKELMGRSMKNHVVKTHAKPAVFI